MDIRKEERNIFSKAKQVLTTFINSWKDHNSSNNSCNLNDKNVAEMDVAFTSTAALIFSQDEAESIGRLCITTVYNRIH